MNHNNCKVIKKLALTIELGNDAMQTHRQVAKALNEQWQHGWKVEHRMRQKK